MSRAVAGRRPDLNTELVEVTPKPIRLRKKHLTENDRKRASRQAA